MNSLRNKKVICRISATNIPRELYQFLSLDIAVDGTYEILDMREPLDWTIKTDSRHIVARLMLGELPLVEYEGEPKENIELKLPEEKIKLLLGLIK